MNARLTTLCALAARGQVLATKNQQPTPRVEGKTWYRFVNEDNSRTKVYLYDEIGMWGVTAGDFVRDLATVVTPGIDLHINSPGGSVFDGVAIHAALVNHQAHVASIVDGVAASAASFIAMAGNERVMEKPATMMIHDASGLTIGNAADHREMADILDQLSDNIAGIYADRAGGSVQDWRDVMQATRWYNSTQALEAGLVDRIANDNGNTAPDNKRSQLIRARARVTLRG